MLRPRRRALMTMTLAVLLLGLVVCTVAPARHSFRTGDSVPMAWRESRTSEWQYQPAEACPKFAVATQVIVPRPLVSTESKYLELAFDGQQFVTPLLLVYHPKTKQKLQRIEMHFEYAGTKILSMTHKAVYDATGGGLPDRVMITMQSFWHEHASRDTSSGMAVLLIGSFAVAGLVIAVVLADEFVRARVFIQPASDGGPGVSSHSSSPLAGLHRKSRLGNSAENSSNESTPRSSARAVIVDDKPSSPAADAKAKGE